MNGYITLQSGILQALGISIIHSLWEGALILAPVLLVLSLVRKDHSRLRYIVLYTGLMAMLFIFLYTFLHVFQSVAVEKSPDSSSAIYLSSASLSIANYTDSLISGNIFSRFLQWILIVLDPVTPVLAMLWLIGFTVAGIRILTGLYVSQAVIRKNSILPEYNLQSKFNRLCENLNISKWIQLRLSARKISPMVVGILKPAVIIPIAALSNLSPDQVEAIITHELAHIRRYDHVFLIIQKIAEQILFFHPVAWYLASAINREREHCCDDLVLKTSTNPLNYIKALTMVQEMNLGGIVPSNAVISKPKRLLSRITRLIRPAVNHSPLLRLAIMFAFLITAGFVFATTIGNPFHSKHDLKQTGAPVMQQDTTISQPDTTKTIIMVYTDVDSSRYYTSIITSPEKVIENHIEVGEGNVIKIIMAHDTIKEILVNGKPVPPEEYEMYKKSFKAGRIEINIQDEAPDSVGRDVKEIDKEIEIIIRDSDASSLYNDYMNKYLAEINVDPEVYSKLLQEKLYLTQEERQQALEKMKEAQEKMFRAQKEMQEHLEMNQYERQRMLEEMQKHLQMSEEERQRALEEMTERLKMQEEAQEKYRQAQKEMQERLKLSEEERQQAQEKLKEIEEKYRQALKTAMQERYKFLEEEIKRILEEKKLDNQENSIDQEKLEKIKEDALRMYEEQQKTLQELQKKLNDSLLRNSPMMNELPNLPDMPDLSLAFPFAQPVPDIDVIIPAVPEIEIQDPFITVPAYPAWDNDEAVSDPEKIKELESTLQELEK